MRTKQLFLLTAALLTALWLVTLTACDKQENPADTEVSTETPTNESITDTSTDPEVTQAVTETGTDAPQESETPAATSEPGTEAEEPAAAATTAEEDTEVPDPYTVPVAVGTSYDGKTTCYDGRFQHPYETFSTTLDVYDSIQAAVDDLEGIGGSVSVATYGDVGLCLSVNIPKDGNFYRIYYNYNNCDFVFNYGYTFDDGTGGYAYYSDLAVLDAISGLDGGYIYCWSDYDELEAGYYQMTWVGDGQGGMERNYNYEKVGELADTWPGLPYGETYWD